MFAWCLLAENQAVLRALYVYFMDKPLKEVPHIEVLFLHPVFQWAVQLLIRLPLLFLLRNNPVPQLSLSVHLHLREQSSNNYPALSTSVQEIDRDTHGLTGATTHYYWDPNGHNRCAGEALQAYGDKPLNSFWRTYIHGGFYHLQQRLWVRMAAMGGSSISLLVNRLSWILWIPVLSSSPGPMELQYSDHC